MTKFYSKPEKVPYAPPMEREEPFELKSEDFALGFAPDIDPLKLPTNAFADMLNACYQRHQVIRRNGLVLYPITSPNTNKILGIYAAVQVATGVALLRFTKNTIHKATASGWVEITPSGIAALAGSDTDYFNFTFADDRIFFSNNGVDPIREVVTGTSNYVALGNAPNYRYITSAFNRIVGAYLVDAINSPIQVGWSADLDYAEWDNSVDFTAGFTPLIDSPSDTNDDITGLFNMSNNLIIPRQRSIWIANRQPSATNPFYFYAGLPRRGADTPRAIELTEYGLVWYNFQTSAITVWNPGSEPEEIDMPIRRTLRLSIDTPDNVWCSYSRETKEYTVYVSSNTSTTTKAFVWNFIHKNWSYSEYNNVSEVSDIDFSGSSTTIDDLGVGAIDSLAGTIDSLGGLVASSSKFFGFNDGELATESPFSGLESEETRIYNVDGVGVSTPFTTILTSKVFEIPRESMICNLIRLELTPYHFEGSDRISLQYRKNGGDWITAKTIGFEPTDAYKPKILQIRKSIKCRTIQWRVTTDMIMFSLHNSLIRANEAGISDE